MESYLVGEDLWDVVDGNDIRCRSECKKWKRLNAKAEFALKRSISHNLFDHIIRCKSAHEIWQTLDRLLNKGNEARENRLAEPTLTQGKLYINNFMILISRKLTELKLIRRFPCQNIRLREKLLQSRPSKYERGNFSYIALKGFILLKNKHLNIYDPICFVFIS